MKKTFVALASAAVIAGAALLAPTGAEARSRGGAIAAGVLGGLALGAIAGGAYAYGPGPYYYGPAPVYGPRCWWERQRVWNGYGWTWGRVQVCR